MHDGLVDIDGVFFLRCFLVMIFAFVLSGSNLRLNLDLLRVLEQRFLGHFPGPEAHFFLLVFKPRLIG